MTNAVTISEMRLLAESAAKSRLFGFKTSDEVLTIMAVAQAEGLHPAAALQQYDVIGGRPTLKATAMLARFQSAGGSVRWKVSTATECEGVFAHPQGGELSVRWDIARAIKAQLATKGGSWDKHPAQMLRARCISEGVRAVFPGCIGGFYSPEELPDQAQQSTVIDVAARTAVTAEDVRIAEAAVASNPLTAIRTAETLAALKAIYTAAAREAKRNGDDELLAKLSAEKELRKNELTAVDGELLPADGAT